MNLKHIYDVKMLLSAEDIEAGTRKKFQTEPTLPIVLKVSSRFKKHTSLENQVAVVKTIVINGLITILSIWTGRDGGLSMRSTQHNH